MNNIISNDCKHLQGITVEHLDELTMVNIALLTLLMWSIQLMAVLCNLNRKTKDSY